MCVPILRSIGTKLAQVRKYAKIVFYLTSRDAKTQRRASWGLDTSDMYLIRNILKPTRNLFDFRFKCIAQIVVFEFSVTLTLTFDLCSIFCVTRIAHDVLEYPWRSFIRIRPVYDI